MALEGCNSPGLWISGRSSPSGLKAIFQRRVTGAGWENWRRTDIRKRVYRSGKRYLRGSWSNTDSVQKKWSEECQVTLFVPENMVIIVSITAIQKYYSRYMNRGWLLKPQEGNDQFCVRIMRIFLTHCMIPPLRGHWIYRSFLKADSVQAEGFILWGGCLTCLGTKSEVKPCLEHSGKNQVIDSKSVFRNERLWFRQLQEKRQ